MEHTSYKNIYFLSTQENFVIIAIILIGKTLMRNCAIRPDRLWQSIYRKQQILKIPAAFNDHRSIMV